MYLTILKGWSDDLTSNSRQENISANGKVTAMQSIIFEGPMYTHK